MTGPGYALVTGASRGIGRCFARALAARKHDLALVARSQGQLEALASELRASYSILAEPLVADLSSAEAPGRLAAALRERGLPIDLLVNNAGFGARGEFWKVSLARQAELVRLNVQAVVELAFHLLPRMVEQGRGGIINVSSLTGFQPVPYANAYAASKAFVTSFSMGLAEELRPYGVRVVTLCPGGTKTSFVLEGEEPGRRKFPGGPQAPEEVVAEALAALDRGGGLVVPRWINKITVFSQRFFPRSLPPRLVAKTFRPRGEGAPTSGA